MAGLLDGKSALITGGGGGIGRATALVFAREGARVAVADVALEAAAETVAQINAAGGQAMSLSGEVTSDADVQAMVAASVAAYGRLDCAFNNAGIAGYQVDASGKKTAEWSEAAFDRMIAGQPQGGVALHEARARPDGGAGRRCDRQHRLDRGSCRACHLIGLCRRQARRRRPHQDGGDRIRLLQYPGECGLPRVHPDPDDEDTMRRRGNELLAQIPFRRMGNPEEIAEMVVWLCSDRASYASGVAYNVDGGWMAV